MKRVYFYLFMLLSLTLVTLPLYCFFYSKYQYWVDVYSFAPYNEALQNVNKFYWLMLLSAIIPANIVPYVFSLIYFKNKEFSKRKKLLVFLLVGIVLSFVYILLYQQHLNTDIIRRVFILFFIFQMFFLSLTIKDKI